MEGEIPNLNLCLQKQNLKMPVSVEALGERFDLDDEKIRKLKELYEREYKKRSGMFEYVDGTLCLMNWVLYDRYEKHLKPEDNNR